MFNFSKKNKLNFKALHEQADGLIGRIPAIKKRRRLNRAYKILKYFGLTVASLFLILLILLSAQILSFKRIYDQAVSGKDNLEQAVAFARQENFSQAEAFAGAAENNFIFSIAELGAVKENYFINNFPAVLNRLNDAESLLVSAQFLSRAVYGGANFGKSIESLLSEGKRLNFSKFTPEEKRAVLKKIFESAPELNGIKADLDLAYLNLERVDASGVLFPLKGKIDQTKEQINKLSFILAKAVPFSQLIPAIAGYPAQVEYLVMLQNNDELRPTGGFLGTYGILRVKDGEITDFKTDDIYHLDMPVQDKINVAPPEPIKKYLNNKWYLRDANWSPDWPTAARKIEWFYRTESRLNPVTEKISRPDGVIAITPKLITDFLNITGPITIEGQSYDKNNFQSLLQYRVEKGYEVLGVPKWERKDVIGEIAKELKIRIFDLPSDKWSKAVNAVIDNLTEKNLMFYLADNQLQSIAVQNGWAGEIKDYYGDYLMVVDSNMAALKTDAVMNRGIDYKVSQGRYGIFSRLTLSYAHNGKPDWKTGVYKSYTRVYAPAGSQLIGISGQEGKRIDIGEESGKTYFGFYHTVNPGEISNITVEYKLPDSVISAGNYGLYAQKQPGKELNRFSVDLSFGNSIKSYSPTGLYTRKAGLAGIKWQGDLNMDRSFEVKF